MKVTQTQQLLNRKESKKGKWWLDNEYKRRSNRDITGFCGWQTIVDLADDMQDVWGEEYGALIAALMEGGFRISEVCQSEFAGLRGKNIKVATVEGRKILHFDRCLILKKYTRGEPQMTKVGKTYPDRRRKPEDERQRDFVVPLSDGLAPRLVDYAKSFSADDFLFPFSRKVAYNKLVKVNPDFWCHRVRSERAHQLAEERGWDYARLMLFFSWVDAQTAMSYTHPGWQVQAKTWW